jgi:RNA-binding protein YhbY
VDKDLILAMIREVSEAITQGEVVEVDVRAQTSDGTEYIAELRRKPFVLERSQD